MDIKLEEALERMIELSQEQSMCCYFTCKNISMQMKIDEMCTEQVKGNYLFKDFYCTVNKVEFSLDDVERYEYFTEEEARNRNDSIVDENLRIYFIDGTELIIMKEV